MGTFRISSDIYPFSNPKDSFIIFYVKWNAATVVPDCNLLIFSKETYDYFIYDIIGDELLLNFGPKFKRQFRQNRQNRHSPRDHFWHPI